MRLAVVAQLVSLLAATSARADPPPDLDPERVALEAQTPTEAVPSLPYGASHWQPHWPRFHLLAEGLVTLAAEGAALAIYFTEPERTVRWLDPAPLDPELRDALRLENWDDRTLWVDASNYLLVALLAAPIVVDALILAGLVHGDTDVMLQLLLIDAETLAIAHLVTWLTSRLVGRARPIHRECVVDDTCADRGVGPVASFASGHALMAYAAAGLVCTHHLFNPWLTGAVEGAVASCASGLVLATSTSIMRVMVDVHWASDVVLSALIGSVIGFGVPLIFHYARPRGARSESTSIPLIAVRPGAGDEPTGLTVFGAF